MAIDTSEIRVGVSGSVYVAPTGTTAPTDATTALDAAFVDLGAINEDGLGLAPSRSIEKVRAWQSSKAVRTIITEDELSLSFALQQWNEDSIALAFGGGTFSVANVTEAKFVPPAAGTVDERSFVFEWVDGSLTSRLYVPKGMVTDVGEITVGKSGAIELALTVEVLGSTPNDFIYFTDDPAVETA